MPIAKSLGFDSILTPDTIPRKGGFRRVEFIPNKPFRFLARQSNKYFVIFGVGRKAMVANFSLSLPISHFELLH